MSSNFQVIKTVRILEEDCSCFADVWAKYPKCEYMTVDNDGLVFIWETLPIPVNEDQWGGNTFYKEVGEVAFIGDWQDSLRSLRTGVLLWEEDPQFKLVNVLFLEDEEPSLEEVWNANTWASYLTTDMDGDVNAWEYYPRVQENEGVWYMQSEGRQAFVAEVQYTGDWKDSLRTN